MAETKPLQHVFEVRIKGSIQAVWEEITKRGAVQRFCFDTVLESDLKPGSPYRFKSPNGKYTFTQGKILEVDPPRRFVHTYQFSHLQDPPTRVTWELEQVGDEVKVTLLHDQFDTETQTYKMVKGGWASILKNLKAVIETGDIPLGMKMQYFIWRLFMPFMMKASQKP